MKMASVKADNVFGQVLICLRMSKLDYMVKETPYSAYVTIRKKFIKSIDENMIEMGNVDLERNDAIDNLKRVEKENSFLKQRLKEQESECGILKIEQDEIEIKNKVLEKEKNSLEDDIEQVYAQIRDLKKTNNKLSEEKNEIEACLKQKSRDNEKQEKCEKKFAMSIKELEENVMMLENVVETRDLEIYRLKEDIESFEASSSVYNSANCEQCENGIEREKSAKKHLENNHLQAQEGEIASTSNRNKFKCDECDFLGDSTNGMKMHMTEAHEMECDICNQSFRSEDKLEYHICKLHRVMRGEMGQLLSFFFIISHLKIL